MESSHASAAIISGKTLEQALRVPQALKDKNGGNGWPPADVARALGLGSTGGNFYYVVASSRDYGLTTGSRNQRNCTH
jgi:hypothetical protein